MDIDSEFDNNIFEIEPDDQGLLVEFAFLLNGSEDVRCVKMYIKGTLVVTTLRDINDEQIAEAKQAVRKKLASLTRSAGTLLSSMGKTAEDIVADPSLINIPLGVGFTTDTAELATFGVGVLPTGIQVTSAVIKETVTPPNTTNTLDAWTCEYCGTSGHTGNFCEKCGAERPH